MKRNATFPPPSISCALRLRCAFEPHPRPLPDLSGRGVSYGQIALTPGFIRVVRRDVRVPQSVSTDWSIRRGNGRFPGATLIPLTGSGCNFCRLRPETSARVLEPHPRPLPGARGGEGCGREMKGPILIPLLADLSRILPSKRIKYLFIKFNLSVRTPFSGARSGQFLIYCQKH